MKKYFPQLDGLRAIAAGMVLTHHYWPKSVEIDLSRGRLGVDLFFVLSGYLITRSLLSSRDRETFEPTDALKSFQKRRFLRIVPLYYVTLLLACYLPYERTTALIWHALFLSNILFVVRHSYVSAAGHLWALAIDQQFYLLWPLAVLFVARRRVAASGYAMIACGLIFRVCCLVFGWSEITRNVMTFTAFESLGSGAVLATWMASREDEPSRLARPLTAVAVAGFVLWVPHAIFPEHTDFGFTYIILFTELSRALLLTWLVAQAVWGIPGAVGKFLQCVPMRALGLWSYGIYLSHNFFLGIFRSNTHHLGSLSVYDSEALIALGATLVWSAAAYYWLERPLGRLAARWSQKSR